MSIVRNDFDAAQQIDQAIDDHETFEYQYRPAASLSSRGVRTTAFAAAAEQPTVIAAARAMIAEKSRNISANGSRSGAFASGVASYVPLDTVRRSATGYSQLFRDRPRDPIDDFFDLVPDLSLMDVLNPAAVRRKVERAIDDTEVRVKTAMENARPVPMAVHAATTTVKHGADAARKGIRAAKKASAAAEAYQRERDALAAELDDLTQEVQDCAQLVAAKAAGGTAAGLAATRAAKAAVRWNMHRTNAASASWGGAGGFGAHPSSAASGWKWTPRTPPPAHTPTAGPSVSYGSAWHARARARATTAVHNWARPKPIPTTVGQVAARAGGMAGKAAVLGGGLLIAAGFAAREQMAPRFAPLNEKIRQLPKPDED